MEIIQRIIGKLVGEEVTVEEMELISGGLANVCSPQERYSSWGENNGDICDI